MGIILFVVVHEEIVTRLQWSLTCDIPSLCCFVGLLPFARTFFTLCLSVHQNTSWRTKYGTSSSFYTSIVGKLIETILQCRWISECMMIVFHCSITLFELVRCKRGLQGFDFPLCERQERPPEKLEISITLRKMGNHPKHNTTAQCSAHLVGPP